MEMMADKMTLTFNEKNELQKVVAEDNVRIKREAYRATSGHAVYDMANGLLELTDNPVLVQETNTIRNAEKVIFERLSGKFRTEGGRPKIDFVVPDDKEFDFFGKDGKKEGDDKKKPEPEPKK
jgi:lipopolysaccharide export system protein LptA